MSAPTDATPASNVLGTIGTVFWCIQLVPQIWYNWRRKKTEGLPPAMGFLWAVCAVPMGVYLILQEVNLPMQIQPQIFGTFSAIIWAQILHYDQLDLLFLFPVLEISLLKIVTAIIPLGRPHWRIPYNKGITWPDILVGAIATVLLAGGMLPIYFELGKRQGRVIGINWVFLCIDTLGGLFSIFALVAQGSFDILGGVMYIVVVVLELGIYLSHIIWRIRFREARKEAKHSGRSVEDILQMSNPA
ncbi:hypothetical protein ASPNIDRAFT_171575 [Aspergillus niger ATCC 1015]|uniref:PQ loop repeat protein n=1 Tax=Aspergillus niger (strain ATCC 1015 / CBS 113.46 / FGSC A1144 / LSHB Ac4 / NCTC 3858a / NRRL 328 / USDA 3528.7) TaxID=380704 RepID=G3XSI7_ASPNA|nr:hypothetical protein ASPNIDRAFT_171575 [Aspergillus niger ATCC 1015]